MQVPSTQTLHPFKAVDDMQILERQMQALPVPGRIQLAVNTFGDKLVLSTSFGVQSAVMLHQATRIKPDIPVIFVDTGYLFPETYRFAEELKQRLDINLKVYTPQISAARQEALYGKLWEQGEEGLVQYGQINKVEPMNRALKELRATAWMSGLRRTQASSRKDLHFVSTQSKTVKVHPILDWSDKDIYYYLQEHDLPYHPLWEKGYASVGDWHSSKPLSEGLTEEETRFNGIKRECGLHEASGNVDYQI